MAWRTLLFFMRPAEFSSVIWEAVEKHDLTLIFQHYGTHSFSEVVSTPGTFAMSDGSQVHTVYLASDRPEQWMVGNRSLAPASWGWLEIRVPREVGRILFLAQIGAKTDSWDDTKREVLDNPTSLSLFRMVTPHFRKRLVRPVWAYNVTLGGEASMTRDIWYSEGVAEWVRTGAQLRSVGAAFDKPSNIRFFIEKPTSPIERPTAEDLIREFLSSPVDDNIKWAIGLALSSVVDDAAFEQVAQIALDRRHGAARQMVVKALEKMQDPRAVNVLIDLLADQEVAGYALMALGSLKAIEARSYIEPFLAHPNGWVRTQAKRALIRIENAK